MRLTPAQAGAIRAAAQQCFGAEARVRLFGSRVDDRRLGGDIDLLVQPALPLAPADAFAAKIRFLAKLERTLGERRVDVVVEGTDDRRPIVQVALRTGIAL